MSSVLFLVMMTCGQYSDRSVHPMRSYTERAAAETYCQRKNQEVERIEGKIEARNLLLDAWVKVNPRSDLERGYGPAYDAWEARHMEERLRLDNLIFGEEGFPHGSEETRYYIKETSLDQDPYKD